MTKHGPELEALLHHLADCPPSFLAEPRVDGRGEVEVDAVVGDLMVELGVIPDDKMVRPFRTREPGDRNWLQVVMVATWLAHHSWFLRRGGIARAVRNFLAYDLREVAGLVSAKTFLTNADRREELVRLLLHALDLRPLGESEEQALDRLATVSTVSRSEVLAELREKRERAEELRKEMARKRAREAATRYSRE